MDKLYSTREIAKILNVSDKSVRRYLNSYFSINDGGYQISEKMLIILKSTYLGQPADNLRTGSDADIQEFERVEYFTNEEYEEFHKRLVEYPFLKERAETLLKDMEYHRKSMESKERQMELLLRTIEQKNFLEAKGKGFDN